MSADAVGKPLSEPELSPLAADLFAGPQAPVTKALIFCGWRTITVDCLIDPAHDLADPCFQKALSHHLQTADFIMAAFDCSTKTRAREIPRHFDDGRPAPKPLRSEDFPRGVPRLKEPHKSRVARDNTASDYVLGEIQACAQRGGASVRENPRHSLHWHDPVAGTHEGARNGTSRWGGCRHLGGRLHAGALAVRPCL